MSVLNQIRGLFHAPAPPPQPNMESDPPPPAPPAKEKKNKGTRARVANRVPTGQQTRIIATAQQHPDLSERKIAAITDTDPAHVHRTLQTYGIDRQLTEDYKLYRADVLAGLQARILQSISEPDIKKAPMGSRVLAVAQLLDKERAERGQPGIIIGHGVALSPPLQEAVDRIIERLSPLPQVVEGNNVNDIEDVEANVL